MSSNKSKAKKMALAKKLRQNRRLPVFAIARTARRLTRNVKSRNWRVRKLKLKVK